jgi:hypothetical protein
MRRQRHARARCALNHHGSALSTEPPAFRQYPCTSRRSSDELGRLRGRVGAVRGLVHIRIHFADVPQQLCQFFPFDRWPPDKSADRNCHARARRNGPTLSPARAAPSLMASCCWTVRRMAMKHPFVGNAWTAWASPAGRGSRLLNRLFGYAAGLPLAGWPEGLCPPVGDAVGPIAAQRPSLRHRDSTT